MSDVGLGHPLFQAVFDWSEFDALCKAYHEATVRDAVGGLDAHEHHFKVSLEELCPSEETCKDSQLLVQESLQDLFLNNRALNDGSVSTLTLQMIDFYERLEHAHILPCLRKCVQAIGCQIINAGHP